MATPPALLADPEPPTAILVTAAMSRAITLISLYAVTTEFFMDEVTLFLSQLRLMTPAAALLPDPEPARVTVIICESRSTSSGNSSTESPNGERSTGRSGGVMPETISIDPPVDVNETPSTVEFIAFSVTVVESETPTANFPLPAPPPATATTVDASLAETCTSPPLLTLRPLAPIELDIDASMVFFSSFIESAPPRANFVAPEPPTEILTRAFSAVARTYKPSVPELTDELSIDAVTVFSWRLAPTPAPREPFDEKDSPPARLTALVVSLASTTTSSSTETSLPFEISAVTVLFISVIETAPAMANFCEPAPPAAAVVDQPLSSAFTLKEPVERNWVLSTRALTVLLK